MPTLGSPLLELASPQILKRFRKYGKWYGSLADGLAQHQNVARVLADKAH